MRERRSAATRAETFRVLLPDPRPRRASMQHTRLAFGRSSPAAARVRTSQHLHQFINTILFKHLLFTIFYLISARFGAIRGAQEFPPHFIERKIIFSWARDDQRAASEHGKLRCERAKWCSICPSASICSARYRKWIAEGTEPSLLFSEPRSAANARQWSMSQ